MVKKIAPTLLDQKIIGSRKVCAKNFRLKKFRSTNSRPPKNYLVEVGSVTAKIFLIWINVTRTNVAWTNVTMTVGICLRCSQEPTFKVKNESVNAEVLLIQGVSKNRKNSPVSRESL